MPVRAPVFDPPEPSSRGGGRARGSGVRGHLSSTCGPTERDPDDRNAAVNPAVLVQVLSDGTEGYDRGRWVLSTANAGERFSLTAMDGAIEVDRVYADVELAPAPPRAARD